MYSLLAPVLTDIAVALTLVSWFDDTHWRSRDQAQGLTRWLWSEVDLIWEVTLHCEPADVRRRAALVLLDWRRSTLRDVLHVHLPWIDQLPIERDDVSFWLRLGIYQAEAICLAIFLPIGPPNWLEYRLATRELVVWWLIQGIPAGIIEKVLETSWHNEALWWMAKWHGT
ncbi:MAG: hypothetical protein RMJ19_05565 [Gemmatales bacterium]|nr:hypothetical protein [Gemmatales bacterium]MDW8175121.1 hypothetical protein [Gemmatales bacterium]